MFWPGIVTVGVAFSVHALLMIGVASFNWIVLRRSCSVIDCWYVLFEFRYHGHVAVTGAIHAAAGSGVRTHFVRS